MTGKKQVVLFFDWDETCTSHDTLDAISPPEGSHPGPAFSTYAEAYFADLKKHEEEYPNKERSSLTDQLKFLESLDEVELKSQKRIQDGKLFVGYDPVAMEKRAREEVELRKGWEEMTVTSKLLDGLEVHIISVGWSARFIQAGLKGTLKPTSICANEIEIDPKTGKGTGKLTKSNDAGHTTGNVGIRIAQHKMREMKRILGSREDKVVKLFAGDSNTDLPALLESDVGIILGENKLIRETIERLGLASNLSPSVEEWKEKRSKGHMPKPDLILVVDWFKGAEVIATLRAECDTHQK